MSVLPQLPNPFQQCLLAILPDRVSRGVLTRPSKLVGRTEERSDDVPASGMTVNSGLPERRFA